MNFIKKHSSFFTLLCIFVVALSLRLLLLSTVPNGLQQDELNAGYQGYKIIKTGSDLQGNFLPTYINRFGDYRPAGIFYVDGLSTLLFGLNIFAIRFPSALFGALSIFVVFILSKILSKSTTLALIAALLLAISPWHIVTSRATSEQIVALFCIIGGVIFTLRGITLDRKREYIFGAVAFLISYFFYHTPRVFVPLFLLIISIFATYFPGGLSLKKKITLKRYLWLLTLFMCLVTIGLSLTKEGTGRLSQTSVLGDPNVKLTISSLSDAEKNNLLAAHVFDNKIVIYTKTIIDQYLEYFSTGFLYVHGGLPERYVVPQMGLFYYVEFPLLLIGFYFLIKRKDQFFLIPFIWLLIGPLAASVTTEDIPNVQRALFMLPAFQIIEAYGAYYGLMALKKKSRYLIGFLFAIALTFHAIYFWHAYVVYSPSNQSYVRDDGNEALFGYLSTHSKDSDAIYLPSYQDLPLYYSYFYITNTGLLTYTQKSIDNGFALGKYNFVPEQCPEKLFTSKNQPPKNSFVVDYDGCSSDVKMHTVQVIKRQDDTTAYIISRYY